MAKIRLLSRFAQNRLVCRGLRTYACKVEILGLGRVDKRPGNLVVLGYRKRIMIEATLTFSAMAFPLKTCSVPALFDRLVDFATLSKYDPGYSMHPERTTAPIANQM